MKKDFITILMPCLDQKEEFLKAAINSAVNQSSKRWNLVIIVDSKTPKYIKDTITSYRDTRINMITAEGHSMAKALNTGLEYSDSEFLALLLSDDILDKDAVNILNRYIEKHSDADFFHSSRRYIDETGCMRTGIMLSLHDFNADYFIKAGSPVKHLMCWRKNKSIEIGGFDESLSSHGCDDYDFPWSMFEIGAKFKAIPECLYYYRVHHDFYRLTTHVPIDKQTNILRKMFNKHAVSDIDAQKYVNKAVKRYLIKDKMLSYSDRKGSMIQKTSSRLFSYNKKNEFLRGGIKEKNMFPHRTYYLPKCGTDALFLAEKMCGLKDPQKHWQVLIHAEKPQIDLFPSHLFFDKDLIWHQQHSGLPGHVAFGCLVENEDKLYGLNYISDIVQRISRRREYKTRAGKEFHGWHFMLLNSILNFALERNLRYFCSPTSEIVMAYTDPRRTVKRELFERVYDRSILAYNPAREKNWWVIDTHKSKEKIITSERSAAITDYGKTICICHDIEGGLGHRGIDDNFANYADKTKDYVLECMLSIEKNSGIKSTYNIVGVSMQGIRNKIENNGHAIGFHSYDHSLKARLSRLRDLDYRIKGYRPPQSRITPEISDYNLVFNNFEWLASSKESFKSSFPRLRNRLVKIPILFDDYDLYKKNMPYEKWEKMALDLIKQNYIAVFSLHDCYASYWLPFYEGFLKKIKSMGAFKTLEELSNLIRLGSSF